MATLNEKYDVVIKTAGDNRHQGVLGACHWVVLLAFTFLALLAQAVRRHRRVIHCRRIFTRSHKFRVFPMHATGATRHRLIRRG